MTPGMIHRMAAELDYAFLAEYAKVDGGTLTAVGASYTEINASNLPAPHLLCVAGRIRTHVDDPQPELAVAVTPPSKRFRLVATGELPRDANATAYADKVGYVFVLSTPLNLDETGQYVVEISVEGNIARRLIFTVTSENDPKMR